MLPRQPRNTFKIHFVGKLKYLIFRVFKDGSVLSSETFIIICLLSFTVLYFHIYHPFSDSQQLFKKSLFMYFQRERERERASRGGAERKGDRIPSRLLTASAQPQHGAETHEPWDHDLSSSQELVAQLTEPPECPSQQHFDAAREDIAVLVLEMMKLRIKWTDFPTLREHQAWCLQKSELLFTIRKERNVLKDT